MIREITDKHKITIQERLLSGCCKLNESKAAETESNAASVVK
jgi:hypothetical protein